MRKPAIIITLGSLLKSTINTVLACSVIVETLKDTRQYRHLILAGEIEVFPTQQLRIIHSLVLIVLYVFIAISGPGY